jgi:cytochrome oxidase Cu insertion factor (SCO1/SenC/PrrC family)
LSDVRVRLLVLAVAALAMGALTALAVLPAARERVFGPGGLPTVGRALVGGPFSLVDQDGRRVTDADFRGRYMLVYFGFTFCPDVCPAALQLMAAAIDKAGAKGERITPIFITVDPARDTPELLKPYVGSFHSRFLGLTGTAAEIATVQRAYRVYSRRVEDTSAPGGYTMDHTLIIYLMGPDGSYVSHFTSNTPLDTIVAQLAKLP